VLGGSEHAEDVAMAHLRRRQKRAGAPELLPAGQVLKCLTKEHARVAVPVPVGSPPSGRPAGGAIHDDLWLGAHPLNAQRHDVFGKNPIEAR
jgi:hypothetical protein